MDFLTQTFNGIISTQLGIVLSSISFLTYVSWVYFRYGILPSISHSYYKHDEKWIFRTFMFGIGFPIILMATSWWLVLSGILFLVCGLSPEFKGKELDDNRFIPDKTEGLMHSIGAEGGILAAFIHLALIHHNWYLPIIMLAPTLYLMRHKVKNHTWWIECMAFILLEIGFIISI